MGGLEIEQAELGLSQVLSHGRENYNVVEVGPGDTKLIDAGRTKNMRFLNCHTVRNSIFRASCVRKTAGRERSRLAIRIPGEKTIRIAERVVDSGMRLVAIADCRNPGNVVVSG